jgi:hypothetical protein
MATLRDRLTDVAALSARISDLPDRETVEDLLFSAVTRLAFLHETDACAELDRLITVERQVANELRTGRRS